MDSRVLRASACAATLVVLGVLVLGCGSSGTSSSPSPSPSAAAPAPVSQAMMDAIVKGQVDKDGVQPIEAAAFQSSEAPRYYFVAMRFTGTSGEQVGVWATRDLDGSTLIYAVDDVALNVTQWPAASDADDASLSMTTPGAQEAVDALQ